jgi:F-box protein 16
VFKLYEERKQLMNKWFETWNETQRRQAIEELLTLCKPKQLLYAREVLNKISPVYNIDFTRVLPRVICLYIFSFLDPRSLCRSAQVPILLFFMRLLI